MKTHIQISAQESLSFAWAKFKENWKTLTLMTLVMFAVGFVFGFVQESISRPYADEAGMLSAGTPIWVYISIAAIIILNAIVSILFSFNVIKIILNILDQKPIQANHIFAAVDSRFWRWFGVSVLIGLMVLGVLALAGVLAWTLHWVTALLAVPLVIYIAIRYFFATYLIVDGKQETISGALKEASIMSIGIEWQLVGFGITMFVVSLAIILAGLFALIIGLIPAGIIISWLSPIATVHMYRSVYSQKFGLTAGKTENVPEA